jgi:hypothetical protein
MHEKPKLLSVPYKTDLHFTKNYPEEKKAWVSHTLFSFFLNLCLVFAQVFCIFAASKH